MKGIEHWLVPYVYLAIHVLPNLAHSHVKVHGEDVWLLTRRSVLTRYQICQSLNLQLPSLQNGETQISIIISIYNFYSNYSMRNAGLDEAQAGIKIAGR